MTPNKQVDAATAEVIRQLRAVAAKCKRIMLNPPGGSDSAKSWAASRAAAQLASINRELEAVGGRVAGVAAKGIAAAYRQGLADADAQAKTAGVRPDASPLAGSFNTVDRRRATVLAQQTVGDLHKSIVSMRETTGKVVRQTQALGLDTRDVNRLLGGGTIEGKPRETLQQLRKMVRQAAVDGQIVTVNTKTGVLMHFKPDYYADLVMQTKAAETATAALMERLQSRGIFYVKVIGSNSRRFCTAFVGRVFWIGEGEDPAGHFPSARQLPRGGPPFHPRCTKRFVAFAIKLATPDQIEKGKMTAEERELLNRSEKDAQKAFENRAKTPAPLPAPLPAERQAAVRQAAADARRQLREVDAGTRVTLDRLEAEAAQLSKRLTAVEAAGDYDAMEPIAERLADAFIETETLKRQRREIGLNLVKADRPIAVSSVLESALGPARKLIAEDGFKQFSDLIDRGLTNSIDIIVNVPDIRIFAGRRSYYSAGKLSLATSGTAQTVIHELGHRLEDTTPALLKASLAFLARRTEGEALQQLSTLTGLGYGPTERAWPDEFFDPYVGKDYKGTGTEIISMGLEALWQDPIGFAAKDPDYFEFLFKAVRGVFE